MRQGPRLITQSPGGDDGLVLRFGGCVEFVADPRLRKVEFHVEPGLDEGLVAVLASGTLLAIRLLMDGRLVLHASALDAGGRAVAFCGAPGMGKSTLSVLLSQAGMPLVSDDVLRVDLDDVQPMVWPGATESRLRPHSDQLVELAPPSHVRLTADGRRAVSPPQLCDNTIPLAAVLVPLPTRALEEPQMRRLGQAEALRSLVRFPRVIGWREPSSSLQQFQLLGELVERVPVAEVRVPWGPPFPPRVAEQLVSLVDMLVRNRPTPNAQK